MSYNTLKENLPAINSKLRQSFDSDDPIRMAFRIGGLRRSGGKRGSRATPEWALKSRSLRKILLRSFPRMRETIIPCSNNHRYCRCPYHQRWLASRWVYIAYLYWNRSLTQGQIVCELNMVKIGNENIPIFWTVNKVKMIIRDLKWAAHGLRSNGSGILESHKIGRPRKIRDTTAASIKDDINEPRSNR